MTQSQEQARVIADDLSRAADRLSRSTIGGNPMIRDVIRTLRDGRDAIRNTLTGDPK